ncbi:chemotaxis protein CheW [Rhizobium sp. YJ-22]|uniref:chemotaxis protein CheW n=1 Tax=Rhizobium sp. YJ-22 TaxID=3037556 RepID=UPI001AC9AA32|nr:chemotaxis protein CheW [Rhizobium sp. YJ-22]MBN9031795.1 chemotaxis protein CheW [Hyphomicrobiales bacterium]MDG3577979.1 chemotaxis protein CheW [Rhizobium sp. YJ-22]
MNQPLRKVPDAVWRDAEEIEVLTFDIAGETFALEAVIVREILDLVPETPVPGAKDFVGSVINFRGRIIPLADIRIAFGMEAVKATIDSRIIVIEMEFDGEINLIGIRTDKVNEVTTLARTASELPPSVGMKWRADFISCLVKRGTDFIIVPDLEVIFSTQAEK